MAKVKIDNNERIIRDTQQIAGYLLFYTSQKLITLMILTCELGHNTIDIGLIQCLPT